MLFVSYFLKVFYKLLLHKRKEKCDICCACGGQSISDMGLCRQSGYVQSGRIKHALIPSKRFLFSFYIWRKGNGCMERIAKSQGVGGFFTT